MTQKARMHNFNWSKRRCGVQNMRFRSKKWPISISWVEWYCATATVTPVLNYPVTCWNCQNVSKWCFVRYYMLWIGRSKPQEAEICVTASKQYQCSAVPAGERVKLTAFFLKFDQLSLSLSLSLSLCVVSKTSARHYCRTTVWPTRLAWLQYFQQCTSWSDHDW